jgi:hypothetical protein
MNFVYRIAYIDANGVCIIGMKKISMFPIIVFEIIVNVSVLYLSTPPSKTNFQC